MENRNQLHTLKQQMLMKTVPMALVLMAVVASVTLFWVHRSVENEIQQRIDASSKYTASAINTKLKLVAQANQAAASNDVVVNSIVDLEYRNTTLQKYIRHLKFPGPDEQRIEFVDYVGRSFTGNLDDEPIPDRKWFDNVMQGKQIIDVNQDDLTVASPVRYNGRSEGAVIVTYDSRDFLSFSMSSIPSSALVVTLGDQIIYTSDPSLGKRNSRFETAAGWMSSSCRVGGFSRLRVHSLESAAVSMRTARYITTGLIIAVVGLSLVLFWAVWHGTVLATEPLNRMIVDVENIEQTGNLALQLSTEGPAEFAKLGSQFNSMLSELNQSTVSQNMYRRLLDEANAEKIKAEAARENTLRVVEAAPCGMVMTNTSGDVVLVNSRLESNFEIRRTEILKKPIDQLLPFINLERFCQAAEEKEFNMEVSGVAGEEECYGAKTNGRIFPVEVDFCRVDFDGQPHILATVIDISERVAAAEKLRISEERLNTAIHGANDGVWDWDLKSGNAWYSGRFRELLGFGEEDSNFSNDIESFYQRLHPDDSELVSHAVTQHLETNRTFDVECRLKDSENNFKWFRGRGAAIRHEDGSAFRITGTICDISDLKKNEFELTQRAEETRLLHRITSLGAESESLEDCLKVTLQEICEMADWPFGHVYRLERGRKNRLVSTRIHYVADKTVHQPLLERIQDTTYYEGEAIPGQVIESGKPVWVRRVHASKEFESIQSCLTDCLEGYLALPVIANGHTVAVMEFFTNGQSELNSTMVPLVQNVGIQLGRVVERQQHSLRLQKHASDLERSNQELEQFAYVASHDLQEPLRKVVSFCKLLKDECGEQLDEDGREYLKYTVDGAARMQVLIRDLLEYSRLQSETEACSSVDTLECFQEAIVNLEYAIEDSNATITHGELPVVWSERARFSQILQNLIGNALKYRKADIEPIIHVDAIQVENEWIFSVEDNGIGIAPEYAERVFGVFKRLHGRGKYSGTGIGLAICKRIVENWGGTISVDSDGQSGSTFRFSVEKS